MIYLILAGLLAFTLLNYVILVISDWRWSVVFGFWMVIGVCVLIAWLFVKGMSEVVARPVQILK